MGLTFWTDFADGKAKEVEFAQALEAKGCTNITVSQDKRFPDYDVSTTLPNNKTATFEVKLDRYYNTTDQHGKVRSTCVAVEVSKVIDGQYSASGILTSKANFYAYTFTSEPATFYVIQTSTLKDLYRTLLPRRVQTYDGPHATYTSILLEGDTLKQHSKKLTL